MRLSAVTASKVRASGACISLEMGSLRLPNKPAGVHTLDG
jgi:hypothetical protein